MVSPTPEADNEDARNAAEIDHPALLEAEQRMQEVLPVPVRVVSATPFAARPGVLRGASTLTVKTYLAQQLVFGRPASHGRDAKRGIIGLVGFAGMLTQLFSGSKLDDPYADKWLLDIEAAIDAAVAELADARRTVAEALAERADVQHSIAQSVKPLQVPLFFSNQFAYRGAYLVNDFDNLVCAIQTTKHVALFTAKQSNALIQSSSKTVRRTFASANGYRYTGVSRADIAHGTARAAEALQRWGELPVGILDGSQRAEYGPALPTDSFAHRFAAESTAEAKAAARGD
ncbi:MAG TPA: TIGR03761 family integrating conjugative element protein [Woeseiaceae bacterium]|nr:TIGR03761 family integrating conjugative element protein [Woeseiaceae bacterium]